MSPWLHPGCGGVASTWTSHPSISLDLTILFYVTALPLNLSLVAPKLLYFYFILSSSKNIGILPVPFNTRIQGVINGRKQLLRESNKGIKLGQVDFLEL